MHEPQGPLFFPLSRPRRGEVLEAASLETVVYIPARKNSTRLKDKNAARLGGLPLLAYPVLAARRLRGVDRVFVDTDDPGYADLARSFGAEVPFLREPALATATAGLGTCLDVFLARLTREGIAAPGRRIVMLPTSPFRNLAMLQDLTDALASYFAVKTVQAAHVDLAASAFWLDGRVMPASSAFFLGPGQDVRWVKPLGLFLGENSNESAPPGVNMTDNYGYYVIRNPIELLDIDDEAGLAAARRIVSLGLYDFGMDFA